MSIKSRELEAMRNFHAYLRKAEVIIVKEKEVKDEDLKEEKKEEVVGLTPTEVTIPFELLFPFEKMI